MINQNFGSINYKIIIISLWNINFNMVLSYENVVNVKFMSKLSKHKLIAATFCKQFEVYPCVRNGN